MLVVGLPFSDLLTWATAPKGLGQSGFWAWLVTLWLTGAPAVLALAAGESWRRGHRAHRLIVGAWAVIAISAVVQWGSDASWAEPVLRCVVLAIMLLMLRPIAPPAPGTLRSDTASPNGYTT
ncbi:hypothetical protein [Streptosporangium sp. NPDC051022]|uniref:hypothetical protein n=1 Tax=Streptosporangium sp. NPDC051022 TaxID=3155752 RepID=UPI00343A4BAA